MSSINSSKKGTSKQQTDTTAEAGAAAGRKRQSRRTFKKRFERDGATFAKRNDAQRVGRKLPAKTTARKSSADRGHSRKTAGDGTTVALKKGKRTRGNFPDAA